MSEPIDDGGPAFPVPGQGQWEDPKTCKQWNDYNGMSLRDWFAGQALASFAGHYAQQGNTLTASAIAHAVEISEHAYAIADAMLAARKQP